MKKLEDMNMDELVDWAAGEILKGLIAGELRSTVWRVLNSTISWADELRRRNV